MCPSLCLFLSVHVWGSFLCAHFVCVCVYVCVCVRVRVRTRVWFHHLTSVQLYPPNHTMLHTQNRQNTPSLSLSLTLRPIVVEGAWLIHHRVDLLWTGIVSFDFSASVSASKPLVWLKPASRRWSRRARMFFEEKKKKKHVERSSPNSPPEEVLLLQEVSRPHRCVDDVREAREHNSYLDARVGMTRHLVSPPLCAVSHFYRFTWFYNWAAVLQLIPAAALFPVKVSLNAFHSL